MTDTIVSADETATDWRSAEGPRFKVFKADRPDDYWVSEWGSADAIGYVTKATQGEKWYAGAWGLLNETLPTMVEAIERVIRFNESLGRLWDGPFTPQAEYPVFDPYDGLFDDDGQE